MQKAHGIIKALGPGLLMAGAAIGVSHLVQSTRAGADYGFALVGFVLLANLFKYPFFEFGPRYTIATGNNLLHGYKAVGTWAMVVFGLFTLSTMFIVLAALTLVTAGLAGQLFGIHTSIFILSVLILVVTSSISLFGRYPALDTLMKVIIVALALSTITAVVIVLASGSGFSSGGERPAISTPTSLFFIVALMGWMPSVIDISVWHSIWTTERSKQTGYVPRMSEALFDFNLGYIGTAVLALFFLSLGALVMHGSGVKFSDSSVIFASQLVDLYTKSLGAWTRPLITIAAFTTMFSTTLVVTDAYPRVLTHFLKLSVPAAPSRFGENRIYMTILFLLVAIALAILHLFLGSFKSLVDLATTVSFLTTPLLAFINYKAITHYTVPENFQPGVKMRTLSWAGIIFWAFFSLFYLALRFWPAIG